MDKVNIQLPFFTGFYESEYEYCDTDYYAIQEAIDYYEEYHDKVYTQDDFEFDYEKRRNDIIKNFVESFANIAPKYVTSVNNSELVSPRYYNFDTDKIYADIVLADDWKEQMRAFMDANAEWLSKIIKEKWSSRDGFTSFMLHYFSEWYDYIFEENDERYIGEMISYQILKEQDCDFDSIRELMYEMTMDEIIDYNYAKLKEGTNE